MKFTLPLCTLLVCLAVMNTACDAAPSHPTLPTRWAATVMEDEVGVVLESYKMVDKPTPSNPSAKWTNFTDGSCQRLIFDGDLADNARYLLGCDALDCCVEDQEGNHIEYQIPNVHPAFLTKVESLGKHTISQNEGSKIVKVTCDIYSWKAGLATYYAYTTEDPKTNGTVLNRWTVSVEGKNFTNDYFGYTAPTNVAEFDAQFSVPAICNNAMSCGNAYKLGKISKKSLNFVRGDSNKLKTEESDDHPTLPTMWTATVNEAEVGTVLESYIMIDRPTPSNPSAKWTNFTDGSCQRLIYDGNNYDQARYLLGCDAVPCCAESQEGNHMEYQIPNIHPAFLAKVSDLGEHTIEQSLDGKTMEVKTQAFTWSFGPGKWYAFVSMQGNQTVLHRWVAQAEGKNFTNDYFNYVTPNDVASFKAQFGVPAICAKAPACSSMSQLSEKSLNFLRNGEANMFAQPSSSNKAVLMKLIKNIH